jgi:hypothetical protein
LQLIRSTCEIVRARYARIGLAPPSLRNAFVGLDELTRIPGTRKRHSLEESLFRSARLFSCFLLIASNGAEIAKAPRGARHRKSSSSLDRLPLYQTGEIYDTWKVSRESKSHSAPAGGVSAYALPFLAKMAMMADRSDKSIGFCLVWRHIPRTNSLVSRLQKLGIQPDLIA